MSYIPSQVNLKNGLNTSTFVQDSGADSDLVITAPSVIKHVSVDNSQMVFQSTAGATFSGSVAVTGTGDVSTASYSLNTVGAGQASMQAQINKLIQACNSAFNINIT
jgi:hypothetical protein